MIIWVGMFFALSLWKFSGRQLINMISRRRTEYAVTNRRILIRSGYPTPRNKSLDLDTTQHVGVIALGAGVGTIVFDPQSMPQIPANVRSMFRTSIGFNPISTPSFLMIEDAAEVYRIIIEAKDALRSDLVVR